MRKFLIVFFLLNKIVFAQNLQWQSTDLPTASSFRALSVVDDSVAWISGSLGTFGRTINGGKTWEVKVIAGHEKKEFRSLYAFNDSNAVIANTGNPAIILRTVDGGINWSVVYFNADTSVFFDGIDFWNAKEGVIYGDPMHGKLFLLRTIDGGLNWTEFPESSRPAMREHEASFAASGTAIRCYENQKILIATGGSAARLFISDNKGITWDTIKTPMTSGRSSTGIFSVAQFDKKNLIIVGGDYLKDTLKQNHVFYSHNGGRRWISPIVPTRGYRECVTFLNKKTAITCGPSGADITYDGGKNWQAISTDKSFHVVRKARNGNLILAAGKGKTATIFQPHKKALVNYKW